MASDDPFEKTESDTPAKGSVRVLIDQGSCERTGVCEQVCPEDVFLFDNGVARVIRAHNCTYCWICVENCVSGSITLD